MGASALNYWKNLAKLLVGDNLLLPRTAVYAVTAQCNLNCAYCEDFGPGRSSRIVSALPLAEALRVLRVIRTGVDRLIFTGGEPLVYPDIVELVSRARRELGFRGLTLLTNGLRLPECEALLPAIDRLVISLDTTVPERLSSIIGVPQDTAETILENVCRYAHYQRQQGYRLVLNCVLTPETLGDARQLLEFAGEHNCLVSFSPQSVNNWPRYDLLVSSEYRRFLDYVIELKRRGAPVAGSLAYLRAVRDLRPYTCYPTLAPRIMPNGELVYPCRPIERENSPRGGRPCNLLEVDSLAQAFQMAFRAYGWPPRICNSCFQQCFAEPSLLQAQPLTLLNEMLFYRPSRIVGLASYSPG